MSGVVEKHIDPLPLDTVGEALRESAPATVTPSSRTYEEATASTALSSVKKLGLLNVSQSALSQGASGTSSTIELVRSSGSITKIRYC